MLSIPELAMNPLAVRVISLFTTYDEHINFKQFIQTLNVFSPKAPLKDKIKSTKDPCFDFFERDEKFDIFVCLIL